MTSLGSVLASAAFLPTLAIFLVGFPNVGLFVAKSRWSRIAWIAAFGVGGLGEWLWHRGLLGNHREAVFYWAPLYQLFMYSLALSLFLRMLKRPPRNVVFNWNEGFFWDRTFAICVILVSVSPIAFLVAPR